VGNTLTRPRGGSALPPDDTPALFMPDSAEHDPHDPCGPGDLDLQLAEIERQFQDGPLRSAHHADMTLAEVLRAVPTGSRRAPDQQTALDAALAYLDEVAAATKMQPRKRRRLEWWIRAHIWFASWGGEGRAPRGVSSPGRQTVCDLIRDEKTGKPMSETSYKRCRRFWEAGGFTAICREGWTPDLSPGILRQPGRDHNTTQAYVICIPTRAEKKARRRRHGSPSDQNGPLSGFSSREDSPTRAREGNPENRFGASCCYQPGSPGRPEPAKPAPREAGLRVGVLARVTDGWFRHLTRLFAGLSAPDLLWVIDHKPDGAPHLGTDDRVRHPVGWLRHRLSFWIRADGTRRPIPREEAAQRAELHRRQLAEARAEADRVAAAKASPAAQQAAAVKAAEQLAARSAAAAKVMARRAAERPAGDVPAPRPAAAPAPVARPAPAGRSVASLARQLQQLKQAGQLDDQARAEAFGTWQARRSAPEPPQDAPGAAVPAEPPGAAVTPTWGVSGGAGPYDRDPAWRALMDAVSAAAIAEEAAQLAAAEGHGDVQETGS
jgi:hypothetical protein